MSLQGPLEWFTASAANMESGRLARETRVPSYSYQCLTGQGDHRDGLVVATSRESASAQLEARGWRVLVLQATTAEATPAGGWRTLPESPRPPEPRRVEAAAPAAIDEEDEAVRALLRADDGYATRKMPRPKSLSTPTRKLKTPRTVVLDPSEQPPRVPDRQVGLFTMYLSMMLNAGFTYTRSLAALCEFDDLRIAQLSKAMLRCVEAGMPVSGAVAAMPHVFEPCYVVMVRLGERTGRMTETLRELAMWLNQREDRRSRLLSALAYPAFILLASFVMVAMLVYWMLPKYVAMFAETGTGLPALTQTLMLASRSPLLLAVPLAVVLTLVGIWTAAPRSPRCRRLVEWAQYDSPLIGPLFRQSMVSAVCRNLGMLLDCGVSTLDALSALRNPTTGWRTMDDALASIGEQLRAGSTLTDAMESTNLFPPAVLGSVRAGEQSGCVEDMMRRAAYMIEQAVEMRTDALLKVIEPAVMLGMGIVVGFIVLAAFLPVFKLMQTL